MKKRQILFLLTIMFILFSCENPVTGFEPITWIEVGSANGPAFESGWTNYSSTTQGMAFGIDQNGFLHIVGTISDTTPGNPPEIIFTLPEGYRPSKYTYDNVNCFSNANGEISCVLTFFPDGRIQLGGDEPSILFNGDIVIKL